jgi:hypothetical protein
MRKIIYSFLALGAIAISSCSSDPCKDKSAVDCKNGGTWVASGSNCNCVCAAGYSGTDCSTLIISSGIIKSYANSSSYKKNTDPIASGPAGMTTKIEQAQTGNVVKLKITNVFPKIACSGDDVFFFAEIVDSKTIKFTETIQCDFKATGTGTIAADGKITFTYNITNTNGDKYEVTTNLQ